MDDDLLLLKRLTRHRQARHPAPRLLGEEALRFYKLRVAEQKPALVAIARIWEQLIPELFLPHTCLEGFTRGTLTVLVDSASHLYELRQVLLAGLEQQLLLAARAHGLRRISLKRGRWYDPDTGCPIFPAPAPSRA